MRSLLICALVVCLPNLAEAQAVQRPTRPYRGLFGGGPPPDPNRTRQELTFTASFLGGYDDVVTPTGVSPTDPTFVRESGFAGFGDANLRYWYGRNSRYVSLEGGAYSNVYSDTNVTPSVGTNLRFIGETELARTNVVQVRLGASYDPSLVLGAYGPLLDGVTDPSLLPDSGQTAGFVEQRSWSTDTALRFSRRMTTRQTATLEYGYSMRTYLDELGYDNKAQLGTVEYEWAASRRGTLRGTYEYSNGDLEDFFGLPTPLISHTMEFGGGYTRRFSPSREMTLTAGAGATHVDTLSSLDRAPITYWTPSGYGSLGIDIGRSWMLSASYRRAINVLQGVSLQSFATDVGSVRADGLISRRLEGVFSASYSNGTSGSGEEPGRYETYNGNAQLNYALSRCCAVSLVYDYYYYNLTDVADLSPGLPPRYDRNAVRVGFSLWLPLVGTYATPGERRQGGS
jgi:hypothetical protein